MAQSADFKYVILLTFLTLLVTLLSSSGTQAQKRDPIQISGIIRDESREPLPYAHIIVVNAGKGSIADKRGRYSFIVYPNDTLIFSSLGHERKQVVVPEDLDVIHYSMDVQLDRVPFEIEEVTVFPWATYEQFSEAFIALDLPEDDYDRAIANIALIQTWMEMEGLAPDPAASFRYAMHQHHYRSMYAGQPPNNLLNPFAWGQFIQAIREGRFQRR
jgi:hypothetical protein